MRSALKIARRSQATNDRPRLPSRSDVLIPLEPRFIETFARLDIASL